MRTIFKAMGPSFKEEYLQFVIIKLWNKRTSGHDADFFQEDDVFDYFKETYEAKNKNKEPKGSKRK